MPFMIHIEVGTGGRPVADSMLGSYQVDAIPFVEHPMPEIIAITVQTLTRRGDGISQRHNFGRPGDGPERRLKRSRVLVLGTTGAQEYQRRQHQAKKVGSMFHAITGSMPR